jgi:ABC-2 type transport system ATP-binding protein
MGDERRMAIVASGVCKAFGDTTVLDGIDLAVEAGTIFGLLGPNGAGKTTIVRILSTLIAPDAGQIRVAGCDLASDPNGVRAAIGVTGQFSALDELLTGEQNLRLMADLNHLGRVAGRRRVAELLEEFDLAQAASRPVSTYSGGMRRRLDLAMTLVGSPQVIFLDEPTTGLDPRGRHTMWDAIRALVSDGVTIFLTTQYLDEADELAGRIALLDQGRIVAQGTPAELKQRIPGGHISLQFTAPDALHAAGRALESGVQDEDNLVLEIPSDGSLAALRGLLDQLDDAGIEAARLSIHAPNLDDVFFAVTGHATVEGAAAQ